MSNSEDIPDKPPLDSPSVEEVLSRVAAAAGAKNDAALARSLCVSPQTLSSWRKRGTVPHEAIASFAAKNSFSIDYLLLGAGPAHRYDGAVDPLLMEEIAMEFEHQLKSVAKQPAPTLRPALVYDCAIVYNRIVRTARPEDNRFYLVRGEVKYLLDLRAREGRSGKTVRVHPEIARHVESLGTTIEEIYATHGVSKVVVDHRAEARESKRRVLRERPKKKRQ